jgi:hypothetical protein
MEIYTYQVVHLEIMRAVLVHINIKIGIFTQTRVV